MSIALYIMVGLFRTRRESNEAAIKYLIMGAFASAFILYGIALIYGVTGSTNIVILINTLQFSLTAGASVMTLLGMLLIVSGFAFKLAFVPFHMWTPDVYQGAPTPLTGFMSVAVKAAAYCAFITVLLSFQGMHTHWVRMLQVLAVLTMTIGNIAALRQKNIKRMLAYSSIAHAGYILVGIVALSGVGKYIEAGGAIYFYLVGYLLMNIGAFTVAFLIAGKNDAKYDIDDYKGLSIRKPFLAAIMAVFMFSLIGIPPFVGFMAKFQIFYAAVKADFIVLVVIGVLNSVVAVFYYLRVVVNMYMREPERKEAILLPRHISAILILLALGILLLGLFPSLVMNTVNAVGMHF
jgi:NADH-quinone oxidoreductase subunit N